MKNRLIIFSVFAVLFFAAISASSVAAQADQIVGGYGDISVRSRAARRAADFALKARSTTTGNAIGLLRIKKAEQQVVARRERDEHRHPGGDIERARPRKKKRRGGESEHEPED